LDRVLTSEVREWTYAFHTLMCHDVFVMSIRVAVI